MSNSQPLISILIPAFRAYETLPDTISSVIAQTYSRWEVIIASDDQSDYLAHLKQNGIQDSRITQVYTNGVGTGESTGRNAGLTIAQGELIANLDADDAYQEERLAQLFPLALEYGAVVDNTGVYGYDGESYKHYKCPFSEVENPIFLTTDHILKPRIPLFPVFKREFAGHGWTRVKFAADVLFNLELFCRVRSMVSHANSLYHYYKRAGSITQSSEAYKTADQGYESILDLLQKGQLDLTPKVRTIAIEEFTNNRQLNRIFKTFMQAGKCQHLEEFLEMSENGQADWVKAEIEALKDEPL